MLRGSQKFDVDEFVSDCLRSFDDGGADAVKETLERVLFDPAAIRESFGQPTQAGLTVLYPGPELVVENMVWAPGMSYPAHDHRTPVITGVYAGGEANDFYRSANRSSGPGSQRRLIPDGTVLIQAGETVLMDATAIHQIRNPDLRHFTGAFHIYIGDYLPRPRSIWYPDDACETASTFETTRRIFDLANQKLVLSRV